MNKYYLCKTQEEYDWLMKKLEKEGYRWNGGGKLSNGNEFAPRHYTLIECWSDSTILYENIPIEFIEDRKDEIKEAIQVSDLMKEEKEKPLPQVVYLVQRKISRTESESVVDKLFRTFRAAERYVLGQGAKPSGYYCYEDDVYKYEIYQMIMEVEE